MLGHGQRVCAPNYRLLQVADENADIPLSFTTPAVPTAESSPFLCFAEVPGPRTGTRPGSAPSLHGQSCAVLCPSPPATTLIRDEMELYVRLFEPSILTDASSKGLGFAPGVAPTAAAVTFFWGGQRWSRRGTRAHYQ